jgi:hypothetical protein
VSAADAGRLTSRTSATTAKHRRHAHPCLVIVAGAAVLAGAFAVPSSAQDAPAHTVTDVERPLGEG